MAEHLGCRSLVVRPASEGGSYTAPAGHANPPGQLHPPTPTPTEDT